mmetsp:Transcript_48683/g.128783  ORF Transcript_48683/g.128783 Transcript_48683/m.128783 type:complete len:233 (+) Transcript_48683:984-1682(+)
MPPLLPRRHSTWVLLVARVAVVQRLRRKQTANSAAPRQPYRLGSRLARQEHAARKALQLTFASAPKLVSLVETLPGNPAHADIASSTSSPTASSVAATADAPCQAAWELLPAKSDRAPARSGAAFDRSWSGEEAATDGIDGTLALEPKPDAGGPPALARDPVSELSTVASTSDSIWATRESSAPDGAGESASRPPARSNGAGALFVTRFGWTMILPKPAFLLYAAMGLSICS